jgi:hypothetical protein
MPNTQEKGFVDYVLWGDDGLPLALVEAKAVTDWGKQSSLRRIRITPITFKSGSTSIIRVSLASSHARLRSRRNTRRA